MKRSTSHKVALCRAASSQHPGTVLPKFRVCCLCSESAPILHCAKQHRKGVAAEGKILFLEPGFMVGSALLRQLHCSTGWHESWGDMHVPTPTPSQNDAFQCYSKHCLLNMLKKQYLYEETKTHIASILCSRTPFQKSCNYDFRAGILTVRTLLPHQTIISCRIDSKEDINSE